MSVQPVEGRVVSTPSRGGGGGSARPPRTEYVYVRDKDTPIRRTGYREVSYGRNGQNQQTRVPRGIPAFLGNREIIFGAWAVSMAFVSYDEWRHNNILPRPLRLWDTTWVFAGLAILSVADPLVPLANALAIGYLIVLMYQFFTGKGNFGGPGV